MSNPLTNGKFKKRVKEVFQNAKNFSGQKGTIYIHKITFEDGSSGEYHSQKDTCTKFTAGNEAEFECEVKVNGQYTNYKIKPVDANGGNFRGGGASINVSELGRYYAATESYKMAFEMMGKGLIQKEQLVPAAKRHFELITEILK